jgi:predicted aspartyl protease
MRLACSLFTLVALSAAAQDLAVRTGVLLKTSVAGHALVLNDVFLNGAGPFRMLIDTGNASSIVRPQVARRLNLKPAYSVDQASVAGVRRVPMAILDEVRAGSVSDRSVEAIIGDVFQAGVDGVLAKAGLSATTTCSTIATAVSVWMVRLLPPASVSRYDPTTAVR